MECLFCIGVSSGWTFQEYSHDRRRRNQARRWRFRPSASLPCHRPLGRCRLGGFYRLEPRRRRGRAVRHRPLHERRAGHPLASGQHPVRRLHPRPSRPDAPLGGGKRPAPSARGRDVLPERRPDRLARRSLLAPPLPRRAAVAHAGVCGASPGRGRQRDGREGGGHDPRADRQRRPRRGGRRQARHHRRRRAERRGPRRLCRRLHEQPDADQSDAGARRPARQADPLGDDGRPPHQGVEERQPDRPDQPVPTRQCGSRHALCRGDYEQRDRSRRGTPPRV